jgi:AAA family ATP:ADP antiporter
VAGAFRVRPKRPAGASIVPVLPVRHLDALQRRLGLEPPEGRLLALMGSLIALLVFTYTIAKVLRDALFLREFGALALPYAYVAVALASAGFVWIESRVARRFPRNGATRFNQVAAIVLSILAAVAFPRAPHWTAGCYFVWTGSQAMMLLPHFWVLALDVWDSRRARRLFPLLSGCGLLGGMAGGGFAAWAGASVGHGGLIWIVSGLLVAAHGLTRFIENRRPHRPGPADTVGSVSGWQVMLKSRYVKVLTLGLALSVVVGTLVDFQFKVLVQRAYPDPRALTHFLGTFYLGLNAVSLVIQFGVAGWLLHRFGLRASTGLQPGSVMLFAACAALTKAWWGIVVMRWAQGVVSQTLGKTSTEIYYAAIRPHERRRIKPAIDTLVERWSDAAVGVLLIVVLHLLRVPVAAIAAGTALVATGWLAVLFILDRQYGLAFQRALSSGWIDPEAASESMRLPSARRALLRAMLSGDEHQIELALQLCGNARDAEMERAVRGCLKHPSPAVRTAAVAAMEAMRLPDPEGAVESLLGEPHEEVRRAAVGYLLERGADPAGFARSVLAGGDPSLQRHLLDALYHHPRVARGALTWEWIDARLESDSREDRILAALALGAMSGEPAAGRLRKVLANGDAGIQAFALLSATRHPSRELLDVLLPLLLVPELSREATAAVAAVGDPAVPALQSLLGGRNGPRAQSLATRTLARIATPRAVDALTKLSRSGDPRLRHLGLQSLARMRLATGRPVLPRATCHRLFLRELHDYRACLEPAFSLEAHASPEVQLLGESYRESADRALERALEALACWYNPDPLLGAFKRLKARDTASASTALEYLGHILPLAVFRPVSRIFEEEGARKPGGAQSPDRIVGWIRAAWESGDPWLRACSVRASRYAPGFDPIWLAAGDGDDVMVRMEIEGLAGEDRRVFGLSRAARQAPEESPPC